MSEIKVRINGRGNAWPVILGQEHPFYDRRNIEDLANASCSILKSMVAEPKANEIEWDLMIDAGHGAVQYLLKNFNRIPDAVFITHPHIDHTLGLDWIVQSYYKIYQKKYPIYTTILCWKKIIATFPHINKLVDFKELVPFQKKEVNEVENVKITPFPAYHGKSADGATMLFFEIDEGDKTRKVLFTGDILCPLLREEDYKTLNNLDLLVTDANNRFPYPNCNHWSILKGKDNTESKFLKEFIHENSIGTLVTPHLKEHASDNYRRCFNYFFNKKLDLEQFYFTIESFIQVIQPKKVALLHYSGAEDKAYYEENILNTSELEDWVNDVMPSFEANIKFYIPYVSQHMNFVSAT